MIFSAARIAGFLVLAVVMAEQSPSIAFGQKKSLPAGENVQAVALEVAALQTLHRLDLTDAQLEALARFSKSAASSEKPVGARKVTPAFTKALTAFRNALAAGDDEKIDDLREKLAEIMDKEKIALDDRVAITDSARRNATLVIRMMQPGQVLAYLQIFDEDEVDLLEILGAAIENGANATQPQWKAIRDQAAAEGAWLLAGGEEIRHKMAAKMLAAVLDQHHGASKTKTSAPDLTKQVQQMTATLDPFVILRNAMEREVAELLSNPRLANAIQHTMAQRKKVAAK